MSTDQPTNQFYYSNPLAFTLMSCTYWTTLLCHWNGKIHFSCWCCIGATFTADAAAMILMTVRAYVGHGIFGCVFLKSRTTMSLIQQNLVVSTDITLHFFLFYSFISAVFCTFSLSLSLPLYFILSWPHVYPKTALMVFCPSKLLFHKQVLSLDVGVIVFDCCASMSFKHVLNNVIVAMLLLLFLLSSA